MQDMRSISRTAALRSFSCVSCVKRMSGTARPALRVTLPATAEIRFIANGRAVAGRHASRAEYRPVEPGPHRVEVRHAGRPWIFSNHVHVTS